MLKGYMVPQSPEGKSAATPAPPWHYASACIAVEFWTDPAAISALLPAGVEPDSEAHGRAFFWFLDWQFTGSNDELTDPARYQYREAFLLVEARLDGKPVNLCPYIFVDNDAALARGWIQGYPKKLGSIFQTRSFAASNPAAAPIARGSRFGASVSAHGERMATARIQLEEPVADPTTVFNRATIIRRYFPQLTAGLQDKPAVNQLTLSKMDDLTFTQVWSGSAELTIPDVAGEDMHRIAPHRIGKGYRFSMSYSVTDLPILRDYLA